MSLDELSIDGSESWSQSVEWPKEKSEKQREASKKAQSQLQKTQKDEKKAQGEDTALFQILIHFIKNPYYEELIPSVTWLLEIGYPSRYILALVALVYPDAALYLFQTVGSHAQAMKITELHRHEESIPFDEGTLHPTLREWISNWVNATEKFLCVPERSIIVSQKFYTLLSGKENELAIQASEYFFRFFFSSRNIVIPQRQAYQYARFITDLIMKSVETSLEWADQDLRKSLQFSEKDLFGI